MFYCQPVGAVIWVSAAPANGGIQTTPFKTCRCIVTNSGCLCTVTGCSHQGHGINHKSHSPFWDPCGGVQCLWQSVGGNQALHTICVSLRLLLCGSCFPLPFAPCTSATPVPHRIMLQRYVCWMHTTATILMLMRMISSTITDSEVGPEVQVQPCRTQQWSPACMAGHIYMFLPFGYMAGPACRPSPPSCLMR
jgi:hypothetical protein